MYLAYLDDSGTGNKTSPFQMMTAVIIADLQFTILEILMSAAVEAIIPWEKMDSFEEFHAFDLYWGKGIFEGMEQEKRFTVIKALLTVISKYSVPIVYGAVDKAKLAEQFYGSADPVDCCFRSCMSGIDQWLRQQPTMNDNAYVLQLGLLIVDDYQDGKLKNQLRNSFRRFRKQLRPPTARFMSNEFEKGPWQLHDAMYFGNSKDSIGLQLADLCGYFIARHLQGFAPSEGFYDLIKDQIVFSKLEPESAPKQP
ncbi:MAG TPA: DUF3800 domain-containing protein [Candidatus Acidoferrales bacterium]